MIASLAVYTIALALAVAILASLAFVALGRRQLAGAASFAALVIAAAVYALGSLFEIRGATVAELHVWLSIEYFGIAFLGPLWLLFALSVAGLRSPRAAAILAGIFAFGALVLVMVWTNDSHHLFYTSIELARRGPFSVSILGKGPWYWAHMACMNGCILAANAVFLGRALRSPVAYRRQAFLMFVASLFPWGALFVYLLGFSPSGLDIAPFGLCLSAVCLASGLFRHKLLDLGLIAYERIFEGMREGVLVLDRKGRVVGANPAMARILGAAGRDMVGEAAVAACSPCPPLAALVASAPPAEEDLRIEGEGGLRHYSAKLAPVTGRGGRRLGAILSLDDITVRVELMQRLSELATLDGLTGVANRRTLLEIAELEVKRARRQGRALSLLILDLDEFKKVNDRYGHQAGDAVLRAAARACVDCLRSTDRLGRYGGEEFLAVLPEVGPAEALAAAERLREAIARAVVEHEGRTIAVTASVGCAGRDRVSGETVADLVREADAALYRAKARGRNRVES